MAAMAERTWCAILAVMHPNKNSQQSNLLYRISASLDFAAAARSVMVVAAHPDNPDQRVMVTVKCNLTAHPEPMAFGFTHDGCFTWQGVTEVDMSRIMAPLDREDSSALDEAKRFLEEVLADGEMAFNDLFKEARECGIRETTLRRAADALGVDAGRIGETGKRGGGKWVWRLPPKSNDLDGQTTCGTVDHLNQSSSNERSAATGQREIIKMTNDHLNGSLPSDHLNAEHVDHLNSSSPESDSSTDSSTSDDEPIKMVNSAARDMTILINGSDDDANDDRDDEKPSHSNPPRHSDFLFGEEL
jgi:hypothetical protein